jgi:hypothetical protein
VSKSSENKKRVEAIPVCGFIHIHPTSTFMLLPMVDKWWSFGYFLEGFGTAWHGVAKTFLLISSPLRTYVCHFFPYCT